MDLLHAGTVGGFCIVSSDSDYTRLAIRIREEGMFVMGVGRSNTIKSFAHACNIFVHTEDLLAQSGHKANRNDLTPHGVPPVVSECEEMKSESKVAMPEHRLLACFAHPDDEAFPVGGALAAHTRRGVDVRLITTTLGEEGEIRQEGSATRETLGNIREVELSCAVRALRLNSNDVWGYRDSGMQGWEANDHPRAFIKASTDEVVERLVLEMRTFRPQVVLSFGPDGLYGHPDHIAISNHATTAFHLAADPAAFPQQLSGGLEPYQPLRLFYSVRPARGSAASGPRPCAARA
ncbi:1D-myo-inositol 2-acetamido-2-deoxy-alpha-D-glucopyranoside deacetylase [Geodia barretti]|uniref:N-acetylglucosaminylphosphatidylinositol deacetylase n=1 Tax=Geodia barretti TaxID=519541 RepID=A0AA35XCV8_GEOBA|nr:1D-myo-inositol 2-acetamido-2-deoxy-alpha-D-glucopyranoside deacetylase [Geodia barretti]